VNPEEEALRNDPDDPERSRLDDSTPERHDMDEYVADGMEDEANVTPDLDAPAEEVAVRIGRESAPDERA
jgi:hypothetical protein